MIMVREVLNCYPGKVGELSAKFKAVGDIMLSMDLEPFRLYTDFTGELFWTLVVQREYQSFEELLDIESRVFSDERSKGIMASYHDLIRQGRREIFKVA